MTSINNLQDAIADAEILASKIKTFSLDTADQPSKQLLNHLATTIENTNQTLQKEINNLNKEIKNYEIIKSLKQ